MLRCKDKPHGRRYLCGLSDIDGVTLTACYQLHQMEKILHKLGGAVTSATHDRNISRKSINTFTPCWVTSLQTASITTYGCPGP